MMYKKTIRRDEQGRINFPQKLLELVGLAHYSELLVVCTDERGFFIRKAYFAIALWNIFLPFLIFTPVMSAALAITMPISATFSPSIDTPPCCIKRLASPLEGASSHAMSRSIMFMPSSGTSSSVVGILLSSPVPENNA